MATDDHDEVIRLRTDLAALEATLDRLWRAYPTREHLQEEIMALRMVHTNDVTSIRVDMISRADHDRLLNRMSALESQVAAASGTSAGTMRIFLVVAVGISFVSLVGGLVDLLLR